MRRGITFPNVPEHTKQMLQQRYLSELAECEYQHASGQQQQQYVQHASGPGTAKLSRLGAPLVETDAVGSVYGAGLKTQREFRNDATNFDQIFLQQLSSKNELVEKESDENHRTIGYVCSRSGCPCTTSMGNCSNSYCCWDCKLGTPCASNVHNRAVNMMAQGNTLGSRSYIQQVHTHWPANASGRSHDYVHFQVICKEFWVADSEAHSHQYEVDGNCTILQLAANRYVFPDDVQEFDAVQRTQRL